MIKTEIPTPTLLLDLDRFERNIAKMAAWVKTVGKKLRPHSKTHKCPEIARRQIAAGAVGICCAKVGEAEVMAASGIRNMLITTEVVGPEKNGLPVEIVSGGSSGTFNIDCDLKGLTELQSGSYCVMDLDYRRIGGKGGGDYDDFEMALTVLTTVVSVPTREMAMVDGGLKAFSTDKPFVPEAVEYPGVAYAWAGDEPGGLMVTEDGRLPA